jgi:hypothetical protein
VYSQDTPDIGYPPITNKVAGANDFRVNYLGDAAAGIDERQGILWSSEAQFYHDVNDYRERLLNDTFIRSLNLPPQIETNLISRQFRPDLFIEVPPTLAKPTLEIDELYTVFGLRLYPEANIEAVPLRNRGPYQNYATMPPLSLAYDSEDPVGDYAGILQNWVLGNNGGFPDDSSFDNIWTTNILSAVNNGLSAWASYRYSGKSEVYRYADYSWRIWADRPCGGTNVPCTKGRNLRNVMMADVPSNTSRDGVFPFSMPGNLLNVDGPVPDQMSAMYIAAIFYDIANEAGLGVYKADQIFWKSISTITNNQTFTLKDLGATVQAATHALWPDDRYALDVADVLASRGIPVNGATDFHSNLPGPIGDASTLDSNTSTKFGSLHPDVQPSVNVYGDYTFSTNGYTQPNASLSDYVTYQLYKHSKYGPCDKVALTDGTFTVNSSSAPFNWSYNNDGTFYGELMDRNLGNVVVFAPGAHVRWIRSRQRCPNEATGFYAEDVRPFGFICTKATLNGFSFTVSALSTNQTLKTYQLTIVDPSTNAVGVATYNWTFVDYVGNTNTASGPVVQYAAYLDQPFTISIDRIRGGETNNLTLRERGNDLDRNGGSAFVRNLVP